MKLKENDESTESICRRLNTADLKDEQQFIWGSVLGGMIGRHRFDVVLEATYFHMRVSRLVGNDLKVKWKRQLNLSTLECREAGCRCNRASA